MLVFDSGAVSHFADRSRVVAARTKVLRSRGLWPPTVPSIVLVECLTGKPARDTNINRLLSGCEVLQVLPARSARRATMLRHASRRGSAVDAVVVATAEPGGVVITGDHHDIGALASHAISVRVEPV